MTDIKASVAEEALSIVNGARRSAYGRPENNFQRICRLWNAELVNLGVLTDDDLASGRGLKPLHVPKFMVHMKQARLSESPDHRDSVVDTVGYTLTYAELALDNPASSRPVNLQSGDVYDDGA